jgi:hypothetical protein
MNKEKIDNIYREKNKSNYGGNAYLYFGDSRGGLLC